MAAFDEIVTWVLRQEDSTLSGRIVDLGDSHGLTRFGVTSVDNPGAPLGFFSSMPIAQALEIAKEIYRERYWNPIHGDEITSDAIAAPLFSFAVNDGVHQAVRLLQQALGVQQDGILGDQTLAALNSADPDATAAALRAAQESFYRRIVAANPDRAKFLNGWLARAQQEFTG